VEHCGGARYRTKLVRYVGGVGGWSKKVQYVGDALAEYVALA
jgi:hypothetical protein